GNALFSKGRYEEALSTYRGAVKAAPGFALGHLNIGKAFCYMGKSEEAKAAWRHAITLGNPGVANEAQSALLEARCIAVRP
ncbi:MAG TPA: tetratricopeptide repeat protein, partial [Pyrinomonadaceae bacterium]